LDVRTNQTPDAMMKAVFPAFDGLGLALPERRAVSRDGIAAKRVLDVTMATLAILLLLPVLALVSLAVKLDSRGPVLFAQRRTGLGGKTFPILKFRSMRVTEDGADVKQAVEGDARITRVGRIIRKLSLDELPQLFNVLAGDMSLVGPRPHAVAHDDYYGARIANYGLRFKVKPGITGWAQVNGARGETPTIDIMQDRINYDAWYARHRNLALDLKILAMTPLEVISTRNAY
jgi:putative colanic acid biosynthesis UDP-glucose lipid carrier transferase